MSIDSRQRDALADQLADTFPGRTHGALAGALLTELATGKPVTPGRLSRAAGQPEADVSAVVQSWPNVEYDGRGAVVAFGGLTLVPTAHSFNLLGRNLFAWCAWDALFLPALLDAQAEVRSACRLTATSVVLSVDPAGIREADPPDLWVTFPDPAATTTADIVGSFCCHVHFLAGDATAQRWADEHTDGLVLDLDDAHALGVRATASLRSRG